MLPSNRVVWGEDCGDEKEILRNLEKRLEHLDAAQDRRPVALRQIRGPHDLVCQPFAQRLSRQGDHMLRRARSKRERRVRGEQSAPVMQLCRNVVTSGADFGNFAACCRQRGYLFDVCTLCHTLQTVEMASDASWFVASMLSTCNSSSTAVSLGWTRDSL